MYSSLGLKKNIILLAKKFFKSMGIGFTSYSNLIRLKSLESNNSFYDIEFLLSFSLDDVKNLLPLLKKSKSQLRQDLFVLSTLNFKTNGYFVEFGAANGIDLSNTFLLETSYAWKGIVAEPARHWLSKLQENRPGSQIENSCVWKDTGSMLLFNETKIPEISTLDSFSSSDLHKSSRASGTKYMVKTISLTDLLIKFNSPKEIDYLSIDTEGSEFEILSTFDFSKYTFKVITCEHNFTSAREKIYDLLTKNGYERKFEAISNFDDWYVKI